MNIYENIVGMYEKFRTMGETSMVWCHDFVSDTRYYEIVREWSCGYPADITPSTGIKYLDANANFHTIIHNAIVECEGYFNSIGENVEGIIWCFRYL